jgi:imidazolonepropionase-like amidohydrolase
MGVGNGPEALMKAVRQRYKNGADVIKITATGGVLSVAKDGSGPQFTMEELHAIRKVADDYNYKIAAHAHGVEGMKRAVLAGINSIEHGTLMNDEIMDLMVEKGTYLVPTMMAGEFVMEKAKIKGYFPPIIVPKALEIGPKIQETFSKAYKKGVKIAFGTDSGVSAHGNNAREFELMVQGGMSPMEAIVAATKTASELLGTPNELGQIAEGFKADIVAVKGNLIEDISKVHQVGFIMKAGKVYKQPQ